MHRERYHFNYIKHILIRIQGGVDRLAKKNINIEEEADRKLILNHSSMRQSEMYLKKKWQEMNFFFRLNNVVFFMGGLRYYIF